jgi:hypothetical protein
MPNVNRPPDIESRVAACFAKIPVFLSGANKTVVASRMRVVAPAIAARVIRGSWLA